MEPSLQDMIKSFMDSLEFLVTWTRDDADRYPATFRRARADVEEKLLMLLEHRCDDGK